MNSELVTSHPFQKEDPSPQVKRLLQDYQDLYAQLFLRIKRDLRDSRYKSLALTHFEISGAFLEKHIEKCEGNRYGEK